MRRLALGGLSVFALALGACASIETQQVQQQVPQQALEQVSPHVTPLPEPPPWNSIEMMWMDTEIVRLSPSASPISS
jgi:hypothetical protein